MGALTSRLLARLRQPDAIRAQVLTHLAIARIHNLVKSSYDDRHAQSAFYSSQSTRDRHSGRIDARVDRLCAPTPAHGTSSTHSFNQVVASQKPEQEPHTFSALSHTRRRGRSSRWAVTEDGQRRQGEEEEEKEEDGEPSKLLAHVAQVDAMEQGYNKRELSEWDWHGFPEQSRPFKLYGFTSTSWMIWATIRTLFMEQLDYLISPATQYLFGMPGNCFVPGRLATPLGVSPLLTVLLTSYSLAWRMWQKLTEHNRLLSLVVFLIASERDLEQFYARLKVNHGRLNSCSLGGSAWTGDTTTTIRTNSFTDDTGTGKYGKRFVSHSSERLFLDVMCYQVYQSNKTYYFKLRSNRTREARARLVSRTALTSVCALSAFIILFFWFLTFIVMTILSDYRYAHVYPGCNPQLEDLRIRNRLDYSSAFAMSWHHMISGFIFDAVDNALVWGDSGLSFIFAPALVYLLDYDLLMHWSSLEEKLEHLLERVKRQFLVREEQRLKQVATFYHAMSLRQTASDVEINLENPFESFRYFDNHLSYQEHMQTDEERCMLEIDIVEAQFEACDFFNQIKRVDGFVGDIVTMGFFIWLAACACVSFNQLFYNADSIKIIINLMSLIFVVITLATYHLLKLRQCCLKSHRVLCSLMAYDQSLRKQDFIKVLDYYATDRTNYHLLRAYSYKPTTFITIIGWSFSCFFISFALFGPKEKSFSPIGSTIMGGDLD